MCNLQCVLIYLEFITVYVFSNYIIDYPIFPAKVEVMWGTNIMIDCVTV